MADKIAMLRQLGKQCCSAHTHSTSHSMPCTSKLLDNITFKSVGKKYCTVNAKIVNVLRWICNSNDYLNKEQVDTCKPY